MDKKSKIRTERTPGEMIAARRNDLGWTQQELSLHSGLSKPYIGRIERDLTMPSLETILILEKVLDFQILNSYVDFVFQGNPELKSERKEKNAVDAFLEEIANRNLSKEKLQDVLDAALKAIEQTEV